MKHSGRKRRWAVLILGSGSLIWSAGGSATLAQAQSAPATRPASGLELSQVERLLPTFNPSIGESETIRFSLTRPARVTLSIWGPNQELIARPANEQMLPAGLSSIEWNGRDLDGNIVPDEAYIFDLRAVGDEASAVWDPLLTSGGDRVVAGELEALTEQQFSYQVPCPCRVLVRAAIMEGPLVRTIVNWAPRPPGIAIENWDGMDADGLRPTARISNLRIAVMAFALPDKSIIVTGDAGGEYRRYFREKSGPRPRKERVVRSQDSTTLISPHWLIPPHLNRDPELTMQVVGLESEAPARRTTSRPATQPDTRTVPTRDSSPGTRPASTPASQPPLKLSGDSALVRVDLLDPDERTFMNNQKFELIIYLDDKRVLEIEQGHVPFNYPLDLTALKPGRHLLTFNVSSFRNHVGTVSRYVEIVR